MNKHLEELEAKIEQVVALVHQLRAENDIRGADHQQVGTERLHLRQTVTLARERLELLVDRLPEEA